MLVFMFKGLFTNIAMPYAQFPVCSLKGADNTYMCFCSVMGEKLNDSTLWICTNRMLAGKLKLQSCL